VKLVFMEKVEVVEESEREIRSISTSMRIPSVVRLVQFRRREAKFSRRNVYARDHYKCQYCGGRFPADDLTCDHVVPRSQGGRAEWSNIVTCCVTCNRRKGGRTPEQAGLHLLKPPARPSWLWGFHVRVGSGTPPPGWQTYLRFQTEH